MSIRDELDAFIDTYLFDVDYYTSSHSAEGAKSLLEAEERIKRELKRLSLQELDDLSKKYQAQNSELLKEIVWRERNGKSPDKGKEQRQLALLDILEEMNALIKNQDVSMVASERRKKLLEIQNEPPSQGKTLKSVAQEMGTNLFHDVIFPDETGMAPHAPERPERSPEKDRERRSPERDREWEETKTERVATVKRDKPPKLEQEKVPTVSRDKPPALPDGKHKKNTKPPRHSGKPVSKHVQPKQDITKGKEQPAFDLDEEVFDEEVFLDATPNAPKEEVPNTPEQRIKKMVENYLDKIPKVDWKKREEEEEKFRQLMYKKEMEERKEKERRRESRQGGSSKSGKKWWHFLR